MNALHPLVLLSISLIVLNLIVQYFRNKQNKQEKKSSPLSTDKQSTFTNSKGEETIYIGACACTKDE